MSYPTVLDVYIGLVAVIYKHMTTVFPAASNSVFRSKRRPITNQHKNCSRNVAYGPTHDRFCHIHIME